jgi:hypothetical protein
VNQQTNPDSGYGTDTLVEPKLFEPGDHERFSHYVKKEKIVESAVMGTPVIAKLSYLPEVQGNSLQAQARR